MPPLCDFICDIIRMSAKEKMIRINAARNVSFMANNHPLRNLTVDNFISNTMRILLTPANV